MKKNYIKLIGSIMCAFSMIMTVALVAIGAQAEEKEITYVPDVTCSELKAEPAAPTGYDRESGYLFAGWYVKDGDNPNSAGYSPVEEPVKGTSYVAKYVPSEVLGVKAQVSGQIVDNDTDKITNDKENNAIRFVTSLDSTEYNHIGFNIKIDGTSYNQDAATTKSVYKVVYGIGADKNNQMTDYYPYEEFHKQSVYFKTYTFTTIPESAFDSDITVTPYWITLDGTRVNGPETAVKTVNYGRAWYYVDVNGEVTNQKAPVGTYSNPYTTLDEAMKVEPQKLYPRLVLKSDIEVDETINVAKTMTIAGLKTADPAKKITYNTDETGKYIFTVAETGNITLEDLHLSGGERAIQNTGGAFTATNVEISDCADKGIQLNGGTANLTDVTIKGGVRGLQLYSSANVTGNNVKIYGPTEYGVACGGASTLDITSLTVDGKLAEENKLANHAVNVYGGSEVTITGGDITNLTTGNGVNAANAIVTLTDVDIAYDEAATGSYEGIKAFKENEVAAEVILSGVTITNAPEHGIQIWQGSSVTGTNVTITTPGSSGILCADADSQFDISTLTISGSGSHGINLNDNGSGIVTGGLIEKSGAKGIYLYKNKVNGASIELSNVQINNSTNESLYLNNASSATVNGTLTTQGGTHGLAIYNSSTVEAGANYEKIDIGTHSGIGVRIYNIGSELDVADMDITGGTNGIELDTGTTVNLTGNVNLSNMTKTYNSTDKDYDGNGIYLKYAGTLNATNATISIDNVGFNAVYIKSGTINASSSTVNLTGGCNYGLRANGGTTTIGELNIDGAKAHSAVRAQGSSVVTINGGTIKNSVQNGVNVLNTANLTMKNVTVSTSGQKDILREHDTATITLTNVTYSSGYGKE